MGRQIIRQPGEPERYAIFSTVTDTFIAVNATADEVIDWFAEQAKLRAREDTEDVIADIRSGERAYAQFSLSWEDALEMHEANDRTPLDQYREVSE
jgi:hypothetical protein